MRVTPYVNTSVQMCLTQEVTRMTKFKRIVATIFAAALMAGIGIGAGPADAGQVRANWHCC